VECFWSYRHPPRVGKKKLAKVEAAPPAVLEIAWKAQARLTARYRALARRGKRSTLVVTAIAVRVRPRPPCLTQGIPRSV